ncbi:uncharacterized protein BDZ99DRAFT_463911 [Mytilinidion resinicola]|uniref:Uncharacterized protein n=1 Tax=Mytilinidion resinicola TaxID=574789 RepID=A0A6A6YKM4_9PEZI|nr:uncharacterized protein BDZ99DRAFT_463911 [Mytilinidion resinicola]KAF2809099.1 hypothetical protein BDZ99DRAFT_463911 [Mytilinidion resinicola]
MPRTHPHSSSHYHILIICPKNKPTNTPPPHSCIVPRSTGHPSLLPRSSATRWSSCSPARLTPNHQNTPHHATMPRIPESGHRAERKT